MTAADRLRNLEALQADLERARAGMRVMQLGDPGVLDSPLAECVREINRLRLVVEAR